MIHQSKSSFQGILKPDISQAAFEDYREELKRLLKKQSVFLGDFVLASGQKSNYYLDTRLTTLSAEGIAVISHLIWSIIQPILNEIDGIAGPSSGADPIVSGVSQLSYFAGHPLKAGYVRKESKGYGRARLVEGPIESGNSILALEDVITTGTSSLRAVQALRSHGCKVDHLICLVLREDSGAELLEQEGKLKVHSIFKASELID
ncbi:MAG: orotate phosphoribosyltransferase [Candidatus Melainabacteria bacterium]